MTPCDPHCKLWTGLILQSLPDSQHSSARAEHLAKKTPSITCIHWSMVIFFVFFDICTCPVFLTPSSTRCEHLHTDGTDCADLACGARPKSIDCCTSAMSLGVASWVNKTWMIPVVPHKAVAEVSKIGNL